MRGWSHLAAFWKADAQSDADYEIGHINEDEQRYPVLSVNTWQYDCQDDAVLLARYYATAVPTTVLALLAEIRQLRADKARLDFLDRMNAALNARYGTTYRWKLILNHNVTRLVLGDLEVDLCDHEPNGLPSCRDAIDAALGVQSTNRVADE
ncbi:hypothetical protein D9M70_261400 [compost metagenome]